MFTTLDFDVRDQIAFVTINRPDKLNALNDEVIAEIAMAAESIATRDDVGGAILTGAGPKAFVAGADIGELSQQGPIDGKARSRRGQDAFRRLEQSRKPIIAAVNGFALGGGCELAMACHIRLASSNAKFGQPEVKLGIGPGYGGSVRLPRLVGRGRALELLLTAKMIDADEAFRIGLVNAVYPPEELLGKAEEMMRTTIGRGRMPGSRRCLAGHGARRRLDAGGQPLRPAVVNRGHEGRHDGFHGEAPGPLRGPLTSLFYGSLSAQFAAFPARFRACLSVQFPGWIARGAPCFWRESSRSPLGVPGATGPSRPRVRGAARWYH